MENRKKATLLYYGAFYNYTTKAFDCQVSGKKKLSFFGLFVKLYKNEQPQFTRNTRLR